MEAFFEKNFKLFIPYENFLFINENISETFFEKHIENIQCDWCLNNNISETFFEKHIENIEWEWLCQNKNISEEFFERHINNVNWDFLCLNCNLSEAFFERHIDKVRWDSLCKNTNLSEEFFEKHILNGVKLNFKYLSENTFRAKHKKEKIISYLKNNPQYSFDNLICKYI